MGGTVRIDDSRIWMVAGWVYDNALERLADILSPAHPQLAIKLRSRLSGLGYLLDLDLRDMPREELIVLLRATAALYRRTEAEGPKSFYMPEFFPGFLSRIADLRELLADAIKDRPPDPS